ncbi:protein phosphatase 2C 57 [Solanum dulcamara]|uniref:protein phosphatase 2C 57 n=1 Tax=Solanum dulcamara TaxID=45834 RepID=UPI00248682C2|nr:protein phosphatase 2C 57 [Solanum dulcamara]
MALSNPHLQKVLLNKICSYKITAKKNIIHKPIGGCTGGGEGRGRCCSAIAIDAPAPLTSVSGIRWGSTMVQGPREEMEDDAVIVQSDDLDGFTYAGVFDGHAGFSSVKFLREELYRECVTALQGGLLLNRKDLNAIRKALQEAFENVDRKLLNWLESSGKEDESGATATALFVGNDTLIIAHVGDSSVVLSRSGKAEILTNSHRPYGNNKVSLQEIRRINEAGGWIVNGRICNDISVSRAFGDMRFKTKKKEMLEKGLKEGRWSEKFISRIQFRGDLVTASPDVLQVNLGSDAEFVLLASDGLWDYMKSAEIVDFVRNQLREHGDVQIACEALARTALDRRTQDNVSIVIADLGRTDWGNLPVQKQNVVFEVGQALVTISFVTIGIWLSTMIFSP